MAADPVGFHGSNLRSTPIRDLGLTIADTRLEPILAEFEGELRTAGLIRVQPRYYLSTEWGVPFETAARSTGPSRSAADTCGTSPAGMRRSIRTRTGRRRSRSG